MVPQDAVLFDGTLEQNIGLGCLGATLQDIENAARIAQLHDFVCTLPLRYKTCVGERGLKLSGGERQRVSIARAVLKTPKLYIFDEATSSLDMKTEEDLLRGLRRVSKSVTTIVIAHRLGTIQHADEIVLLEGGCVAERGTHDALLRRNGRYAAMWRLQSGCAAAR